MTRFTKERDSAILHSALSRFAECGCFASTLDQVAADVGVGKGTLYRHYASREDLFDAALGVGIAALVDRWRSIRETHVTDAEAGFRAVIGDLVALNLRGDPVSPAALLRLSCSRRWLNRSQLNRTELEAAVTSLVQDWQGAGVFDQAADASWIATVTVALVNSPVGAGQGPAPEADIASRIAEVLSLAFAPRANQPT